MGLLSEYVEVTLNTTTVHHYESLGYFIPRHIGSRGEVSVPRHTKIIVKVADLTKGSSEKVLVECDNCSKRHYTTYYTYNKRFYRGENGNGYYCTYCVNKLFRQGKNNPHWNPDITDGERDRQRQYPEYVAFIKAVYKRDNYTCQCCGKKSEGDICVHHLDGYSWCKERRTDTTNGITLCEHCHQNFHLIYGKGNNTAEQFYEWFGRNIELVKANIVIADGRKVICYETQEIYSSAIICAEKLNAKSSRVHDCCNKVRNVYTVRGLHLFWLDEYVKMTQQEIDNYLDLCYQKSNKRQVICLTTNAFFSTILQAAREYGCDKRRIGECCKGIKKTEGCSPNGAPLTWMYYNDFKKLSKEEQNELLQIA